MSRGSQQRQVKSGDNVYEMQWYGGLMLTKVSFSCHEIASSRSFQKSFNATLKTLQMSANVRNIVLYFPQNFLQLQGISEIVIAFIS